MKIDGGYYLKARIIQESEIAHAPPHVREIWDWLLKEANHKPRKRYGRMIKRGQTMRSYKDIQEGLHWMVGYRREQYSSSQCETAMKWLTKRNMITTARTIRGMFITINNYDTYQNPKNYESRLIENHNETAMEPQSSHTINKNGKNDKNGKKRFIVPTFDELKEHLKTKNIYNDDIINTFINHYEGNGWKIGHNKMVSWKHTISNWCNREGIKSDKAKWYCNNQDCREYKKETKPMERFGNKCISCNRKLIERKA